MLTDPKSGTAGYVSIFTEIFSWILTIPAYQALWELLLPSINPYGWGFDLWYNAYARSRVKGHKMGVISIFTCVHDRHGYYTFLYLFSSTN